MCWIEDIAATKVLEILGSQCLLGLLPSNYDNLCSAAVPQTRREETVVVVAYLPLTDFVDTVSRHCEAMQLQIQGLESKLERQAEILDRLRHWVCAQDPNLVPLLGHGPMLANRSGSPF